MNSKHVTCEDVRAYFAHLSEEEAQIASDAKAMSFENLETHLAVCSQCRRTYGEDFALVEAIRSSRPLASPNIAPLAVRIARRRLLATNLLRWGVVVGSITLASIALNERFLIFFEALIKLLGVVAGAFDFSLIVDFISTSRALLEAFGSVIAIRRIGEGLLFYPKIFYFCVLLAGIIACVIFFGFSGVMRQRKEAKL